MAEVERLMSRWAKKGMAIDWIAPRCQLYRQVWEHTSKGSQNRKLRIDFLFQRAHHRMRISRNLSKQGASHSDMGDEIGQHQHSEIDMWSIHARKSTSA